MASHVQNPPGIVPLFTPRFCMEQDAVIYMQTKTVKKEGA